MAELSSQVSCAQAGTQGGDGFEALRFKASSNLDSAPNFFLVIRAAFAWPDAGRTFLKMGKSILNLVDHAATELRDFTAQSIPVPVIRALKGE